MVDQLDMSKPETLSTFSVPNSPNSPNSPNDTSNPPRIDSLPRAKHSDMQAIMTRETLEHGSVIHVISPRKGAHGEDVIEMTFSGALDNWRHKVNELDKHKDDSLKKRLCFIAHRAGFILLR